MVLCRQSGLAYIMCIADRKVVACSFTRLNFQEGTVPQLWEIQEALQDATKWNIRPTAGLMHPRDFLNGLAFKCAPGIGDRSVGSDVHTGWISLNCFWNIGLSSLLLSYCKRL